MRVRHLILPVLISAVTLQVLSGCEESVDPVLGTDQQFSLYGYINPTADTQAVRIFEIDDRLRRTTAEPIDADVFMIDQSSGDRVEWRDSIVHFLDGSVGHVFFTEYRPSFDSGYRLIAEAADGLVTEAVVQTPPLANPALQDVISAPGNVLIEIDWAGAPLILQTEVVYYVRTRIRNDPRIFDKSATLPVGQVRGSKDDGFSVVVEPSRDIGVLYELLSLRPGLDEIALDSMDIRAFVTGETWDPPTRDFDPELLVQPGTFTNVTNGFGFVGSGYFDWYGYVPTDEIRQNAGFSLLND